MRTLWALALLVLSTLPLTAAGKLLILDYHTFLNTGRSSMDNSLAEFLGPDWIACASSDGPSSRWTRPLPVT
jgi:hypothetical protein